MRKTAKRILSLVMTIGVLLSVLCVGAGAADAAVVYEFDWVGKTAVAVYGAEKNAVSMMAHQTKVGSTVTASQDVLMQRVTGGTEAQTTRYELIQQGKRFTIPDTGLYFFAKESGDGFVFIQGVTNAPEAMHQLNDPVSGTAFDSSNPVTDLVLEELKFCTEGDADQRQTLRCLVYVVPKGTVISGAASGVSAVFSPSGKEYTAEEVRTLPAVGQLASTAFYGGLPFSISDDLYYEIRREGATSGVFLRAQRNETRQNVVATGEQADAWAVELVNRAIVASLMPGHLNGQDLRNNITRAQFAALTVKLYEAMSGQKAPAPAASPFRDTGDPEVGKAFALGLTSGVGPEEFGPNLPLTREQAASMLAAVYKKTGGTVTAGSTVPFADDGEIAPWAKDSVYFMVEKGVASGVGEGRFAPCANTTSQSALIMALRMLENLK